MTQNARNNADKATLDPLQRNNINVAQEVPCCVAFQSPHSSKNCVLAQFISSQEVEKEEDLEEGNTDNTICNMVGSTYEYESDEDCA